MWSGSNATSGLQVGGSDATSYSTGGRNSSQCPTVGVGIDSLYLHLLLTSSKQQDLHLTSLEKY